MVRNSSTAYNRGAQLYRYKRDLSMYLTPPSNVRVLPAVSYYIDTMVTFILTYLLMFTFNNANNFQMNEAESENDGTVTESPWYMNYLGDQTNEIMRK